MCTVNIVAHAGKTPPGVQLFGIIFGTFVCPLSLPPVNRLVQKSHFTTPVAASRHQTNPEPPASPSPVPTYTFPLTTNGELHVSALGLETG